MTLSTTGINYIDSLLIGYDWGGNVGSHADIDYGFVLGTADGHVPTWMQDAVRAGMQQWENVADITFVEGDVNALSSGIGFAYTDLSSLGRGFAGVTAYPTVSGNSLVVAVTAYDDVFKRASDVAPGKFGFMTVMHEIGHAIGLNHPRDYSDSGTNLDELPADEDSVRATIMSYYQAVGKANSLNMLAPSGPMIYDIAAIQYLYGANMNYHSGDDNYQFGSAAKLMTIWDAGGHDTLDASLLSAATIDLREGLEFYSTFGKTLIWNAFGSDLEDATGSRGSDKIYGNDLENLLIGDRGSDKLFGNESNDTLYGDDLADTIKGTDELHGGDGDDSLYGGGGNDKIYGDADNDLIYGDDTTDTLFGTDQLYGGDGSDTIYGGGNGDKIYGENGDDLIYAAPAVFDVKDRADSITGGAGNDTMDGGGGADHFYFAAGSGADEILDFEGEGVKGGDVIHLIGYGLNKTTVLSHVSYAGTDATIDLGGGNVILVHGVAIPFVTTDFLFS